MRADNLCMMRLKRLVLSTCLFFSACSVLNRHPAEKEGAEAKYWNLLEKAKVLIDKRYHSDAAKALQKAGNLEPDRPEPLYHLGRALFAMDRFKEASAACRRALSNDPSFFDAASLEWAARLEAAGLSEDSRQKVKEEIRQLLAESEESPEALMAAYQGCKWVDDRACQQRTVLKLAELSENLKPRLRERIASSLFEQITMARGSRLQQNSLMRAYIRHFPDKRFVERITAKLLDAGAGKRKGDESLMTYIKSQLPDITWSARIKVGISMWLIRQEKMPEKTVRLLEEALEAAEDPEEGKPQSFGYELWQEVRQKERSRVHYLLGRALFMAGRFDQAKKELEYAAAGSRNLSGPFYYLGRTAEHMEDYGTAISCFRRALEINDRHRDAEKRLADLLLRQRGYTGKPACYFAGREGTIRFKDVTESAGLAA